MFEQEIKQQWMISNDALITFDTILDCVLKLFFLFIWSPVFKYGLL